MSDNITLPREVVEFVLQVLEKGVTFKPGWVPECEDATATLHNYLAAPRPEPSGYAYRYADGVLRLNDGSQFNGGWPVEAVPYWFATPALAAEPTKPSDDVEALRRDAERYRWMTEDHPENETRRRVYSVTLLFNAHRKEHIDAAIDAAMGDKS